LGKNIINKIKVHRPKVIKLSEGDVLRVLRKDEVKKWNFAEAYFSKIKFGKVKAWKHHLKMTINIVVPKGKVKFVFYSNKKFRSISIGEKNYCRLTIPPKVWFGFKGMSKSESIILSLTNIKHAPKEVMRIKKDKIKFNW
jgi:dTDP-4-dehydrorhamnose 3,5-epimerase